MRERKNINRLAFEAAIAVCDGETCAVASEEQTLRVAESPDDKVIHLDPQAALEVDQQKLEQLHEQMAPLQNEINQLNRQFWLSKGEQVRSLRRHHRQIEQGETF